MSAAKEYLGRDPTSELWGEHRARYRFAARWVAGRRVLDVACGAGFGLDMLRAAGANAIGIDLDFDPLRGGRHRVQADATRLPLPDRSMEAIASFETIEHVPDARALVLELRRVLRPGGVLVLSTPNRAFGPESLHTNNPFHVREFTAPELEALLGEAFEHVQLHGQRPVSSYQFVPYLMVDRDLSPGAVAWKALNRLPFGVKEGVARSITGRPFYPTEVDFWFDASSTDGAHALVAVAS